MNPFNQASEEARRSFIQGAAAACLGVSLPTFANSAPRSKSSGGSGPTADSVIFLNMNGGMSHIDTLDVKTDSNIAIFKGIKTGIPGYQVSELLPNMAKVMDKVTVVNSLSMKIGAHEQAQYALKTSYEQRGTISHPHLGAWVSKFRPNDNPTIPSYVKVNPGAKLGRGYFESKYAALPIYNPNEGIANSRRGRGVSETQFDKRMAELKHMNDAFYGKHRIDAAKSYAGAFDDAVKLMNSSELKAFNIRGEPQNVAAKYGDSGLGKGALLARRLVESGVRFVEVNQGGWDHHFNIKDEIPDSTATMDKVFAALIDDLHQRGMLKRTLVVLATEFGRTPRIDGGAGRSHYPTAFSAVLAGGGMKAGYVHGKTDGKGARVIKGKMSIQDFNATIASAMGLDTDNVIMSPSGRPFQVAHKGKPQKMLFG